MKMGTLVLFGLILGASAFGGDLSEFERGYLEGKATCHADLVAPTTGWVCSVNTSQYYGAATGRTKQEALLKLAPEKLAAAYAEQKYPSCNQF